MKDDANWCEKTKRTDATERNTRTQQGEGGLSGPADLLPHLPDWWHRKCETFFLWIKSKRNSTLGIVDCNRKMAKMSPGCFVDHHRCNELAFFRAVFHLIWHYFPLGSG